ncbi:hypothetical protein [Luteolibacter sp. Populi]|uniref:hypothetical protein n=1 Tax=Luteolibacter sp. Populi TaxID=3230487 RepID=UPI0034659444
MKKYLLLGALLCSHVQAAGEGYMNFVRQTQQGTGVVYSVNVTPEGSAASQGLLENGGALFQLWTIESATAKDYLLDQKLVGAYMPAANITVQTLDPYPVRPRTRVDKPFTVKVNVSNLITSGSNIPDAAKRVLLEHHLGKYTATKGSFTLTEATSGTPKSSASITTNGTTTLSFAATNLTTTPDPTKVNGEEWFVVHALADGTITQSQIASANVQVWAYATGSIDGIASGTNIRTKAPAFTLTLKDLYPGSFTYLKVTPVSGGPSMNVLASQQLATGSTSLSKVLTIADYDYVFPADGTYTMELLTETPFDTVRLASTSVTVNRVIEVRGLLGGLDQ